MAFQTELSRGRSTLKGLLASHAALEEIDSWMNEIWESLDQEQPASKRLLSLSCLLFSGAELVIKVVNQLKGRSEDGDGTGSEKEWTETDPVETRATPQSRQAPE